MSGIDKLRARTELFQTIERNLCCDREPRKEEEEPGEEADI